MSSESSLTESKPIQEEEILSKNPSLVADKGIPPVGLLLVHKEIGLTSHQVVDLARKALGIRKIGHCGTLDPFASGLLILLIGEATRLQHHFLTMNKTYEAEFAFGESTDTLDPTGTVTDSDPSFTLPDEKEIRDIIQTHLFGTIEQVPPRYSAVKVNGKRAYKLSREKKEFSLKPKKVTIHHFHIEKTDERHLRVNIECNSGTYVRALVRDLATHLNTSGMLTWLTRTHIENFNLTDAILLKNLHKENDNLHESLHPLHKYLPNGHNIELDKRGLEMLKNGQLQHLLKRKKSVSQTPMSQDETNVLKAQYQLLFHNNLLVGIWEQSRGAIIYNMAKYL